MDSPFSFILKKLTCGIMSIIILGLGPGDRRYLTLEANAVLADAQKIYLRTARHPVVEELPDHLRLVDFDSLYEEAESFSEIYHQIANEIIDLGRLAADSDQEIIYAVPGHPMVGETTTSLILEQAERESIPVRIVLGLSFIEPTLSLLKIDGLDGVQLFDALEVAGYNHPPLNCDRPTLLAQLYSRQIASELKLSLMSTFPDDHEVVLVHGAGTIDQMAVPTPLYKIDRSSDLSHLTCLFVPPLKEPGSLTSFAETVAILRSPDGCPWDQEQTPQSLRSGLLEETGEVLAAIDAGDHQALSEELGDLLYHIIMQIQMASEDGLFKLSEVIGGIDAKLKRRHPHVWGDVELSNSDEVIQTWEDIKSQEKTRCDSILDNIPAALPALARAQMIQHRVKGVGFDWPTIGGVFDKIEEEIEELNSSLDDSEKARELGDLFFALVNWSRWLGLDAETVLREANSRFEDRFRRLELMATTQMVDLTDLDIGELELLWETVKSFELHEDG
ncbi:MAG: nucleoside triphosphate pyrophosphohydrolase [Anaerolineae bacterium]|nr:MAG: nucleoside triphosphate pyrophosphohydrolase [Anaerolineae bacterium]